MMFLLWEMMANRLGSGWWISVVLFFGVSSATLLLIYWSMWCWKRYLSLEQLQLSHYNFTINGGNASNMFLKKKTIVSNSVTYNKLIPLNFKSKHFQMLLYIYTPMMFLFYPVRTRMCSGSWTPIRMVLSPCTSFKAVWSAAEGTKRRDLSHTMGGISRRKISPGLTGTPKKDMTSQSNSCVCQNDNNWILSLIFSYIFFIIISHYLCSYHITYIYSI